MKIHSLARRACITQAPIVVLGSLLAPCRSRIAGQSLSREVSSEESQRRHRYFRAITAEQTQGAGTPETFQTLIDGDGSGDCRKSTSTFVREASRCENINVAMEHERQTILDTMAGIQSLLRSRTEAWPK